MSDLSKKYFSWSAFNEYKSCGLSYYLRKIEKVRLPRNQRMFLVGGTIADMIPEWAAYANWQQGWMVKNCQTYFDKRLDEITQKANQFVRWKQLSENTKAQTGVENDYEHNIRRLKLGAEKVEDLFFELRMPSRARLSVEGRFDVAIPNTNQWRIRGGWDLYDPDMLELFDLKMTEGEGYEPDQLKLYAMAVMLARNERVKKIAFLYPYKKDKVVWHDINDQLVRDAYLLIRQTCFDIDARQGMEASPSHQCFECEYFKTIHCDANPVPDPKITGSSNWGSKKVSWPD